MFGFLKKDQLLLDESSIVWLFDSFGWALRNLGADLFADETILVTPSNTHFPGRADSIPGIAAVVFEQVKAYAGMSHWPCQLIDQNSCAINAQPKVVIEGALRGGGSRVSKNVDPEQSLVVTYDPNQINNPEAMIASFAHTLAHYLASMAPEPPPGGEENWAQVTEVVAVFMGFGLMFSNSAFTFKTGGCGSCKGAAADRTNYLSQHDITYALAIFSVLKGIPVKSVTPHLKKSLRGFFEKCVKDVTGRKGDLETLNSLQTDRERVALTG